MRSQVLYIVHWSWLTGSHDMMHMTSGMVRSVSEILRDKHGILNLLLVIHNRHGISCGILLSHINLASLSLSDLPSG